MTVCILCLFCYKKTTGRLQQEQKCESVAEQEQEHKEGSEVQKEETPPQEKASRPTAS